jgi:hypothetical protein
MRKKLKLSSDVGDSGSKTCKRGCSGPVVEVWRTLRLSEVWSLQSGGRFCVAALAGK